MIERKIKRAVTDAGHRGALRPRGQAGRVQPAVDPGRRAPARIPVRLAERYTQYGPLKADTAEAVVELLRPVQDRYRELAADPAELARTLAKGAAKAQEVAAVTLDRARNAVGLLPRSVEP